METRRDIFQAIADPTRRAILALVALHAMTPGAIAAQFDSKRQTISKHIQILQECELLTPKQTGREIHYHLNPVKMKEVSDWAEQYRRLWEEKLDSFERYVMELKTKKQKK
jgi:DNA-binding transcriptional ArsR family regulator